MNDFTWFSYAEMFHIYFILLVYTVYHVYIFCNFYFDLSITICSKNSYIWQNNIKSLKKKLKNNFKINELIWAMKYLNSYFTRRLCILIVILNKYKIRRLTLIKCKKQSVLRNINLTKNNTLLNYSIQTKPNLFWKHTKTSCLMYYVTLREQKKYFRIIIFIH